MVGGSVDAKFILIERAEMLVSITLFIGGRYCYIAKIDSFRGFIIFSFCCVVEL